MAKKPPQDLRIADLTDSAGATEITKLTRSRLHQLVDDFAIPTYIFLNGDLVQAEDKEHRGKLTLFNRYDLAPFIKADHSKGGRPRKSSLTTS